MLMRPKPKCKGAIWMTVCRIEKQKKQEYTEPKHISPNPNDLTEVRRIVKLDCKNEVQIKAQKAIEANDLCYNCETGFHYMKQ